MVNNKRPLEALEKCSRRLFSAKSKIAVGDLKSNCFEVRYLRARLPITLQVSYAFGRTKTVYKLS